MAKLCRSVLNPCVPPHGRDVNAGVLMGIHQLGSYRPGSLRQEHRRKFINPHSASHHAVLFLLIVVCNCKRKVGLDFFFSREPASEQGSGFTANLVFCGIKYRSEVHDLYCFKGSSDGLESILRFNAFRHCLCLAFCICTL